MTISNAQIQILPSSTVVNEGQGVQIQVKTQNVTPGTSLNYVVDGVGSADYYVVYTNSANDFLRGQFTIERDLFGSGIHGANLFLVPNQDYLSEGSEFFEFKVQESSSGVIQIVDTSRAENRETPQINWRRTFTGGEHVWDMTTASDSRKFLVFTAQWYGSTYLNTTGGGSGNGGIIIQEVDSQGNPGWYRAIDYLTQASLAFSPIANANILSGWFYDGPNAGKFLVAQYDLSGNQTWSQLFDFRPWGQNLAVGSDGSIYIAYIDINGWHLRKHFSNGLTDWERSLGITDDVRTNDWKIQVPLAISLDGRIWVAGGSISSQGRDGFVTSFNADGDQVSTRVIGVTLVDDAIRALAIGPDGYVYVGGIQNRAWFLAKYAPNGNGAAVWTRDLGTFDAVGDLAITRDGVIYLVGKSDRIYDAVYVFDTNGEFLRSSVAIDDGYMSQGVHT